MCCFCPILHDITRVDKEEQVGNDRLMYLAKLKKIRVKARLVSPFMEVILSTAGNTIISQQSYIG